jgi:hypothetical protein
MNEEFAKRVAMTLVGELITSDVPSVTFQFFDGDRSYVIDYRATKRGFSSPYGHELDVSAGGPGTPCNCCGGTGVT